MVEMFEHSVHTPELDLTQDEEGSGRTAGATVTGCCGAQLEEHSARSPDVLQIRNPVAPQAQRAVSHLVQMDTRVHGSFGLVALQVGVHGLLTHAHGGKHLADLLTTHTRRTAGSEML